MIDHTAIVREVEKAVGPYGELGRRSTYNPRTKRYFGVSDYYVPAPLIWRHDVWNELGLSPATWEHVREAAPSLKASGHPIGIGLANEADSNLALISLMMCFGSFLQDESGALAIDSESTVEAVEFMADLHARGGESGAFDWDVTSNNQLVLSGRGSLIMNAISPIRRAEDLGMPFADELWIWPVPHGPRGRLGLGQYTGVYSVWKFAKNREAAEKFVADLCVASSEAVPASSFFNYPELPGRASREADLQGRGGRPASAEGQVLDPHHGRVEVHAQRRLPGAHERGRRGDSRPIPDPADVRAGRARGG